MDTGLSIGIKHMEDVAQILDSLPNPPAIWWIDPSILGLRPKGDVADYIDLRREVGDSEDDIRESIRRLAVDAHRIGGSSGLQDIIEATIAGELDDVEWPHLRLTRLGRLLRPGAIGLLCGAPGAAKSFFITEALAHMHQGVNQVALYALEGSRDEQLRRILAQRMNNAGLMDVDYVKSHPDDVRNSYEENKAFLDSISNRITASPIGLVDHGELIAWARREVDGGARVIVIDPISAAESGDKPWMADKKFMADIRSMLNGYKASVIIVIHPRKGGAELPCLDSVAGGASLTRLSDWVLWLQATREEFAPMYEIDEGLINRNLYLLKTRNGPGEGMVIGFYFDKKTLCFKEVGIINQSAKKERNRERPSKRVDCDMERGKPLSSMVRERLLGQKGRMKRGDHIW